MTWGNPIEVERHRRIKLAVWAYAYEMRSNSLVDDATFDHESLLVDSTILTGHKKLDTFFATKFAPHTGQWIYDHPELHKVVALYQWMTNQD